MGFNSAFRGLSCALSWSLATIMKTVFNERKGHCGGHKHCIGVNVLLSCWEIDEGKL